MRHSLQSHIIYLETSIQDAKSRLAQINLTDEEVEDLHLQLTLAQSALEHYRQAYALELSLSGSEPPSQPADSELNGGSDKAESRKPRKKKDGFATIEAGIRPRAARASRKRSLEPRRSLVLPIKRTAALMG